LIRKTVFPKEFDKKVDMRRVKIEAIQPWIRDKIYEMLEIEDDVVVNYVFSLLEEQVCTQMLSLFTIDCHFAILFSLLILETYKFC